MPYIGKYRNKGKLWRLKNKQKRKKRHATASFIGEPGKTQEEKFNNQDFFQYKSVIKVLWQAFAKPWLTHWLCWSVIICWPVINRQTNQLMSFSFCFLLFERRMLFTKHFPAKPSPVGLCKEPPSKQDLFNLSSES